MADSLPAGGRKRRRSTTTTTPSDDCRPADLVAAPAAPAVNDGRPAGAAAAFGADVANELRLDELRQLRKLQTQLLVAGRPADDPLRQSIASAISDYQVVHIRAPAPTVISADDLFNLHTLILATSSFIQDMAIDGPLNDDQLGLVRRMLRMAAREAERLAIETME